MFDGLKKKLGRFSEDVEEDVDEEAIEAAEEAQEDTAEETAPAEDEQASAADEAEASATEDAAGTVEEPVAPASETDQPVSSSATEDEAAVADADESEPAQSEPEPAGSETDDDGSSVSDVPEGAESEEHPAVEESVESDEKADVGPSASDEQRAADEPAEPAEDERATDEESEDDSEADSGGFLSRLTGRSGSSAESGDAEDEAAEDEADGPTAAAEASPATDEPVVDEPETTGELDPETPVESAETTAAEPDTDEMDADASEEADADEEDDGRGLAERAKIFATGKTVIEEDDLQKHLDDLELALLSSDVEMSVAQEILDGVKANLTGQTRRRLESTGNLVQDALREALYDVISVGQFDFEQRIAEADKPIVIIFTGVNGVGKTTSIAKLSKYLEDQGYSSVVANGDTYRAGANEQLEQHARNLDKKCISHEQGSDPTAVIYDGVEYAEAHDIDVVLGDTAGRLHTSNDLMAQLEKIDRVIDPDMTLFVDEAVAGQDAVNRAREFDEAAAIDGAILTKADADSQGGAAISVAYVTGKPILFLGTGQGYDDLEPFDPEEIVDQLFEA